QKTGPVIKFSFPAGRIYGPATVQFDLSGSYSPDGDAITEYAVGAISGLVTSATPLISLPLNPGSHALLARVKTATDTAGLVFNLTVYPQWDSAPQVVREPVLNTSPGTLPGMYIARGARLPNGRQLVCGIDVLRSCTTFHQEQTDGS